jgi:hypothetical protein
VEPIGRATLRDVAVELLVEPGLRPTAAEFAAKYEAGPLPGERTIRRKRDEYLGLSGDEQERYHFLFWPDAFERGFLPWEAQEPILELVRHYVSSGRRPTLLTARWYWRLRLAIGLPAPSVEWMMATAGLLAYIEANQDDLHPQLVRTNHWIEESVLAFRLWEHAPCGGHAEPDPYCLDCWPNARAWEAARAEKFVPPLRPDFFFVRFDESDEVSWRHAAHLAPSQQDELLAQLQEMDTRRGDDDPVVDHMAVIRAVAPEEFDRRSVHIRGLFSRGG